MTLQSYIDLFSDEISTYKGVIFYIGSFPYNLCVKNYIIPFSTFDEFNLYLKQHQNIIGKSILFISEPNCDFECKDIRTIASLKPTYVFLDYYPDWKSGSWMLKRWLAYCGVEIDKSYNFNNPSPVEYKYIPIFETTNENSDPKRSWLILGRGEGDENSFKLNFPYNI